MSTDVEKKSFQELVNGINLLETRGNLQMKIRDIHYDSRRVGREDMFVAIRGFRSDGHRFIDNCYDSGCRAFLVEEMPDIRDAAVARIADTRRALPVLARNRYDQADRKLKLVGVTGTNGKTTTAYLLHEILSLAGWAPGLLSTIETIAGNERTTSERTTPESLDIHRLLNQMVQAGAQGAVMEVSSHSLELGRTDGIPFSVAIFTNLGHDHLDFHQTMDNYFEAKKKLFDNLSGESTAVINLDDRNGERIVSRCPAQVLTYSLDRPEASVRLLSVSADRHGQTLDIALPNDNIRVKTPLVGRFNISNILAAAAAAVALGIEAALIKEGISEMKAVPGRTERYDTDSGVTIYVDYAHTPDAMERVLEAISEAKRGRLIVVFGCGGDRDAAKRPLMGRVAARYADRIVLTNDNPRSEDPQHILDGIRSGIEKQGIVSVVPDRAEAIITALQQARSGDSVLVAGKGHETYQEFAEERVHFDDREVVSAWMRDITTA